MSGQVCVRSPEPLMCAFDPLYGKYEIQEKYRVVDFGTAERAVNRIGAARRFYRNTEVDRFYVPWNASATRPEQILKLRTRAPCGEALLILQSLRGSGMIPVVIDRPDGAEAILHGIGARFVGEISKMRSMYLYEEFNVKIDETPQGEVFIEIGTFLSDPSAIEEGRSKLEELAGRMELDARSRSPWRHYHALPALRDASFDGVDG